MFEKKNILGVGITNAKKSEILEYIITGLENREKKYYVVTPNPEFLVLASKNVAFKKVLNEAKIAVSDGIGLMIAGKLLGKPLKERFSGTDLLENLCRIAAEKPITVGFLGSRGNVAEKTAECLQKKYPKLKVAFVGEEWGQDGLDHLYNSKFKIQNSKLPASQRGEQLKIKNLNSETKDQRPKTIDILFVAFGAPKQEIWISQNLEKLPVKVAIGVGGAFDYISGKVPRAPLIIRNLGFEWLFRLIIEPWRIKRQVKLLEFVFLILKEKLK